MMAGLLEKIRSVGHWRVNFRPSTLLPEKLSFAECESKVADNRVELRGWDYPHINRKQDATHGFARADDYSENWIDWQVYVEFWRMYRSSQFLHYKALWEDLDVERDNGRPRPAVKVLSVGSAIYTITEIYEFLFRLYRAGLYHTGATVTITLENTAQRQLWINEPHRMPFSEEKVTGADRITLEKALSRSDLEAAEHSTSMSAIRELFERFGWDVAASTLVDQQTRFLNRQL